MEMVLEVAGYVGYGILCLIALAWLHGVRRHLTAIIPTILGSLTFLLAAVLLPSLDLPLIHAWWIIPAVYCLVRFVYLPIAVHRAPLLWPILNITGSLYAGMVRIGITSQQIEAARAAEFLLSLREQGHTEDEIARSLQRLERWNAMRREGSV